MSVDIDSYEMVMAILKELSRQYENIIIAVDALKD